jgi:rhodanese-related sulfurtransferase
MNRSRHLGIVVTLVVLLATPCAFAQSFNYMTPAELKQRLESGNPPFLLDIQVEQEYAQHHLPGTFPTYAYPARSDEERQRLKPALGKIMTTSQDVVIICPAGGQGARNAYRYLKEQGVPESRMRILEHGQGGWPYPELLATPR